MNVMNKLADKEISLDTLFAKYAPEYGCYKQILYEKAVAKFLDRTTWGLPVIRAGRFAAKPLEKIICTEDWHNPEIIVTPCFFRYAEDVSDANKKVWYLNFADKLLFGYYDSELFAQDEIQTLEHPALAAVSEWLEAKKYKNFEPRTFRNKEPTPILIENVPWWLKVKTAGYDIYGWKFGDAIARKDYNLLNQAITVCETEQLNNIIAVAAPSGGSGTYTKSQIVQALSAVIAAFGGAVSRNADSEGTSRKTIIHTGRWGAGAFGGNEELLILCQILAAGIAGVDELHFHAVNSTKLNAAVREAAIIKSAAPRSAADIVDLLLAKDYCWNVSDGN